MPSDANGEIHSCHQCILPKDNILDMLAYELNRIGETIRAKFSSVWKN